ncbi:hypothetical protein F511_33827 [Dorcoceras hygrometricum]|uniref:Uncharacterized protein n=1 Tax=Dorcoceras hygrometricum TaxID=472368 RepID=A0A2Z7B9M7_9LAMI|nr:hypothetical protein F511_33827 [Dorcoceras hygrometricum]
MSSKKTSAAEKLGRGNNPSGSSFPPSRSNPDSTSLVSQYSSSAAYTNNAASNNRSAASFTIGNNVGTSGINTNSYAKRNFSLW